MRRLAYLASLIALVGGISLAMGHTSSELGPLPSETGAPAVGGKPAENRCTECHFDDPQDLRNLNTPGGGVEILGLPAAYEAGHTYALTVRLHSDSTRDDPDRKWGFQVTAVKASDGEGAGTFTTDGTDTLAIIVGDIPFENRRYVEHYWPGVRQGLTGPVSWTFNWQAPDPPAGKVYFFAAGNAANGSFEPSGDFIFTRTDSTIDLSTPVRTTTWGALKARYR